MACCQTFGEDTSLRLQFLALLLALKSSNDDEKLVGISPAFLHSTLPPLSRGKSCASFKIFEHQVGNCNSYLFDTFKLQVCFPPTPVTLETL